MAVGQFAAMSLLDRLKDAVPHTGRAWLEAGGIGLALVVVIFVVLPRVLRPRWARWIVGLALLVGAGWFTVGPVFYDTRVNERLLGAVATAPPTTARTGGTSASTPAPPATQAGPVRLATGGLHGLAGHSGSGA